MVTLLTSKNSFKWPKRSKSMVFLCLEYYTAEIHCFLLNMTWNKCNLIFICCIYISRTCLPLNFKSNVFLIHFTIPLSSPGQHDGAAKNGRFCPTEVEHQRQAGPWKAAKLLPVQWGQTYWNLLFMGGYISRWWCLLFVVLDGGFNHH